MSGIDWDTELPKLEREFDGLPPRPTPAELRARRATPERSNEPATALGVWARLMLVAVLAGALGFWPYARDCGAGLFTFMGAGTMIAVGGVWVSVCTWRNRMALTHALALLLVLVGLAAVGHQVLPRIGYARSDPVNPQQWSCPSPASSRAVR